MEYSRAIAISAAGLAAEKTRIEAATLNLASMSSSIAPGTAGFRPVRAVIHAHALPFSRLLDGTAGPAFLAKAEIVPQSGVPTRSVYEPGHPDADENGMVFYPAVDHTAEMLTVMTALRAYEANLAALEVTRTLATKALEIGGQ
jgi:flagellar basal-body rod protein FlgC